MAIIGNVAIALLLFLFVDIGIAQNTPNLTGAWELVSQKVNGADHPILGRQIKLLTKNHYVWVRQDEKALMDRLNKHTVRDSMAAYQDTYGAGTYRFSGNTYTETTEFFYDPSYIGRSVNFTFTVEKGLWTIKGSFAQMKGNQQVGEESLEEVWRRSE
ncbi:MAG TPA: hypothetical protein VL126_16055 [Bacteroidota bacterium]|nr:hypothetical protein [Bacteroidota bacterium]